MYNSHDHDSLVHNGAWEKVTQLRNNEYENQRAEEYQERQSEQSTKQLQSGECHTK